MNTYVWPFLVARNAFDNWCELPISKGGEPFHVVWLAGIQELEDVIPVRFRLVKFSSQFLQVTFPFIWRQDGRLRRHWGCGSLIFRWLGFFMVIICGIRNRSFGHKARYWLFLGQPPQMANTLTQATREQGLKAKYLWIKTTTVTGY